MTYQEHIESLADEHGIDVYPADPRERNAHAGRPEYGRPRPWVETPSVETLFEYYRALHEIGHHVLGHVEGGKNYGEPFFGKVVEEEARAHLWALDNAIEPPTPEVAGRIALSISTYSADASEQIAKQTRNGAQLGPAGDRVWELLARLKDIIEPVRELVAA